MGDSINKIISPFVGIFIIFRLFMYLWLQVHDIF